MAVYFGNTDLNITSPQPFYLGTTAVASLWMGSVQVWPPAIIQAYNIFISGTNTFIPNTQPLLEGKLTGETIGAYSASTVQVHASTSTAFTVDNNAFSSSAAGGVFRFSSSAVTDIGRYSFSAAPPNPTTVSAGYNTLRFFYAPNLTTAGSQSFGGQNLNFISQTNPLAQVYLPSITEIPDRMFILLTGSFFVGTSFSASLPYVNRIWGGAFAYLRTRLPISQHPGGLTKISQTEDFGGLYIPNVTSFKGGNLGIFAGSANLISASITNMALADYFNDGWTNNGTFATGCRRLNRISDTDPTWPIYIPAYPTGSQTMQIGPLREPMSTFSDAIALNSASMLNLVAMGNSMFSGCTANQYVSKIDPTAGFYFPSLQRLGDTVFQRNTSLTTSNLPNLWGVGDGAFTQSIILNNIDLTGLRNSNSFALGLNNNNRSVFAGISTSGSITIPTYFATNLAGAPDGDLQYLLTAPYSWTINYV